MDLNNNIDFVGLPGSGKTTLSRRVNASLNQAGRLATNPISQLNENLSGWSRPLAKLPYATYGWIQDPTLPFEYFQSSQKNPNIALLYNWLFVRGVMVWHRARPEITLYDQGMIQAVWSFRLSESEEVVALFQKRLLNTYSETPTLIVCVEAAPNVLGTRLAARANNPSRVDVGRSAAFGIGDALGAYRFTKEEIVRKLVETLPHATMLTVQNNDRADLAANVEVIVTEIEKRAGNTQK